MQPPPVLFPSENAGSELSVSADTDGAAQLWRPIFVDRLRARRFAIRAFAIGHIDRFIVRSELEGLCEFSVLVIHRQERGRLVSSVSRRRASHAFTEDPTPVEGRVVQAPHMASAPFVAM